MFEKQPGERFFQASLKYGRAHKHINELQYAWAAYLQTNFCRLSIETDESGGNSIRVVSDPLPADILLTLGDAIHNLKSALDFAISEVLGHQNTRITFPMSETREELETSFASGGREGCAACGRGSQKGRNAAVENAAPGIGKFILNEIKPYKSAGGFLWELNKLDTRDKHRLLTAVAVPQVLRGVHIVDDNNNSIRLSESRVSPGGVVRAVYLGGGGAKVQNYGSAEASIFFHEIGVIERQPVFPTLLNMAEAVAQTLSSLDVFLAEIGWEPK